MIGDATALSFFLAPLDLVLAVVLSLFADIAGGSEDGNGTTYTREAPVVFFGRQISPKSGVAAPMEFRDAADAVSKGMH